MTTEQEPVPTRPLLEDVQIHLKVIAEGHGALVKRLDGTDVRLTRLEGQFDQLDMRVAVLDKTLNAKVDAIDAKVSAVDAKIDEVDQRFDAVDAKIESLDAKITAVDQRFDAVDAKLEVKFASLQTQLERIAKHLGIDEAHPNVKRASTGAAKRRKAS